MWNTVEQELAQADECARRVEIVRPAFPELAEILHKVEIAARQKAKAMQQLEKAHDIIGQWTIE